MKTSDWLFLATLFVGTAGLTIILGMILWTTLWIDNNFIILVVPLVISTLIAYAISCRRFHSPSQRRLLRSILLALIGVIGVSSGIEAFLSNGYLGSSWYAFGPLDPLIDLLIILLSLLPLVEGFHLILPKQHSTILPREGVRQQRFGSELIGITPGVESTPASMDLSHARQTDYGYLPVAGLSTLIATLLTFVIAFLSVPTAIIDLLGLASVYSLDCYALPNQCLTLPLTTIGVISALGFIFGVKASVSLWNGRYHRIVPVSITLLSLTALLTLIFNGGEWGILPVILLAMCLISIELVAWSGRQSMRPSDWRLVGTLLGMLGAIALGFSVFAFTYQVCNPYGGFCHHTYTNFTAPLITSGMSGILSALLIVESGHAANPNRPARLVHIQRTKNERSKLFQVLILLLGVNLVLTTAFSAALAGSALSQNQGDYTRVEQITITQASFQSSGHVAFTLINSGTQDVTIAMVQVQGLGTSNSTYVNTMQLSGSFIPAGTTWSMSATFPGVDFVKGGSYAFTLISTQGSKFPFSAAVP